MRYGLPAEFWDEYSGLMVETESYDFRQGFLAAKLEILDLIQKHLRCPTPEEVEARR